MTLDVLEASKLRGRNLRHAFFTRAGGVSEGIYRSLNCGFGSKDLPEAVAANRARAAAQLGVDSSALLTVYQVHSANVVTVARPWQLGGAPQADAIVTRKPGIALGILTADCAPVLFADETAGVIGAAHAGWKGALGGVLEATVEAMEAIGAKRASISAAIGPCIHQTSYEVGPEFFAAFTKNEAGSEKYFVDSIRDGHKHFDLPGYVSDRLARASIAASRDAALDTYNDEERFFSYRRTTHRKEMDYGRELSAIVLTG